MKKSAQVVMLPTNERATMALSGNKLSLKTKALQEESQHLYILSDEEIKEGDWFVGFADGSIKPFVKQADESTVEINNWQLNKKGHSSNKKIIATTNKSIILPERFPSFTYLPQPSQSFIEHFVDEYNKGNVITEVMVEYESIGAYANPKYDSDYQLKINSDNTINIINSKDSWSREEVIKLLNSFEKLCYLYQANKDWFPAKKTKWIEEKL
jgi:hypothetical protein